MSEPDEDSLPISGLQHLAFCPRQWGLIHLEQVWHENLLTAEGRLLHEAVDLPGQSRRDQVRTVRGMWLCSKRLLLTGRADVVEFKPEPYPVEYKRGKRKPNDDVQLCAQALCLEEMLHVPVPRGAVYHVKTRRRRTVEFNAELRMLTLEAIERTRALLAEDHVPPAVLKPQCDGCSLHGVCLPELTAAADSLDRAYGQLFATGAIGDSRI